MAAKTRPFLPGLLLSKRFVQAWVQPAVQRVCGDVPYAVALIGPGSDVLGFDTPMSTDHDWGPRALVFLREEDCARFREPILRELEVCVPEIFEGWPTRFSTTNPVDPGVRMFAEEGADRSVFVSVHDPVSYGSRLLGWDPSQTPSPSQWLATPQQRLLMWTGGEVFVDSLDLQTLRDRVAYYPTDVWLVLIAAAWARIGEHEHLLGRADLAQDPLGASLLAASLSRDCMLLSFLFARQYAPYAKWFGSAFARLPIAHALSAHLQGLICTHDPSQRQMCLGAALTTLAQAHNALEITDTVPTTMRPFFGRPLHVIGGLDIAHITLRAIQNPEIRALGERGPLGSIDQLSDDTRLREDVVYHQAIATLYDL